VNHVGDRDHGQPDPPRRREHDRNLWRPGDRHRNRLGYLSVPVAARRGTYYEAYKIRIGRALLLGLEILVAADIVKTIAVELTLLSVALLAGLVPIRTFLSWTLQLEIDGRWPWQAPHAAIASGNEPVARM